MPKRTKALKVFPWTGGLNTSQDESMIGPQDLTVFNNTVYGPKSSKLKRDGINFNWDDKTAGTDDIIGGYDFWYESGSTKVHKYIGVTETGVIYTWTTAGARTTISPVAAAEVCTIAVPTKATLTGGQFFYISTTDDAISYYVWVDKSGADADPNVANPLLLAGKTGVRVDVSADTTAAEVATRLASALDALPGFVSTALSGTVTCTNASNGPASDALNVSWASTTITTTTQGNVAAWTTPTAVSFKTYGNIVIMAATGTSNEMLYWDGAAARALSLRTNPNYVHGDLAPPSASIIQTHLGRLVTNDKSNKDRLHYCQTFNHFKWRGQGDSGAIDIGVGDGDPVGITAIFPTFRGDLFIAKQTKLYRLSGQSPETISISLVSDTIGCEAHNAVASVDTDDLYWVSTRGVHSLSATVAYGDFASSFVSFKIQQDFNDNWSRSRLNKIQACYLPDINSIMFAVTLSASVNNTVFLYNLPNKAWYKWPSIDCQAMFLATDSDKKRVYFGTATTRLGKSFAGTRYDTSVAAVQTSIPLSIETGLIFPEDQPYMTYGFKTLGLIHKPVNNQTITVNFKVDGFDPQPLAFVTTTATDLLGSTFILGSSLLGAGATFAPYSLPVDGFGRGFKVSVAHNSVSQTAEIQGFVVEYEDAGDQQEVVN